MRPKLELSEEKLDQHTLVMALQGELDLGTAAQLSDPLQAAIKGGARSVVVDMTDVTFIDSTGLMVLLNGLRSLFREGGRLVLACSNPTVLRLFEITGTDATFTIAPTREEALAVVSQRASPHGG